MQTLTEPELSIMLTLWEAEQAVPRMFVQKKLAHLNWKTNTFNTYLTRLQEKGYISSTSQGQTYYYLPQVPREEYMAREGTTMLSKLFGGSLKNFILSVSNTDAIDSADLDELRVYLDGLKGGNYRGK